MHGLHRGHVQGDFRGRRRARCLVWSLSSKTSGEAFDLVKTVEDLNGAESWRPLTARFDPKTIGKHMLLARRCVISLER